MATLLHIGDGKCGSSSIQSSLFGARESLGRAGLLYHPIGRLSGHFAYRALIDGGVRGNLQIEIERAEKNLEAHRTRIRKESPDHVLISAESLFFAEPRDIIGLLRRAYIPCDEVRVIAYVRNPPEMYLSLVQQTLKASHLVVPPNRYARKIEVPARRWRSLVDSVRVELRPFDSSLLFDGDVVSDFEDFLRKSLGDDDVNLPRRRENSSLSAEQMIVMQEFRRDFHKEFDGRLSSPELVRFFESTSSLISGTRPRLTQEAYQQVAVSNRRRVEELHRFYPERGFDRWLTSGAGIEREWSETDVREILSDYCESTVGLIRLLIPHYNPALHHRLEESVVDSLNQLGFRREGRALYAKFLAASGCPKTSEAVLDVSD